MEEQKKEQKKLILEVDFTLKAPLKVGVDGDFKEVTELKLYAPKGEHVDILDKLGTDDTQGMGVMTRLLAAGVVKTKKYDVTVNEQMLESLYFVDLIAMQKAYAVAFIEDFF